MKILFNIKLIFLLKCWFVKNLRCNEVTTSNLYSCVSEIFLNLAQLFLILQLSVILRCLRDKQQKAGQNPMIRRDTTHCFNAPLITRPGQTRSSFSGACWFLCFIIEMWYSFFSCFSWNIFTLNYMMLFKNPN